MPFLQDGGFAINREDSPYEAEICYYLAYHVKSALVSIERLLDGEADYSDFENEAQYRHYYTDHLIFSLGQISNRFWKKNNQSQAYKARVDANIALFDFHDTVYPVLCTDLVRSIRNTIEHLEEYNITTIQANRGVGGFNTISKESDSAHLAAVQGRDDVHIYTLDLIKHYLYVKRGNRKLYLDIDSLKQDLNKLYSRIQYVNSLRTVF